MNVNAVRKDTTSYENNTDDNAPEQNFESEYTEEPQGQQPEAPVQPEGDKVEDGSTPNPEDKTATEPPSGAPDSQQPGDDYSDPKKFAAALLEQLGQAKQSQTAEQAAQPEASPQDVLAQRRQEVTAGLTDTVKSVEEQLGGLQQKMESGDIDLQTYMVQRESLNEQKWDAQRQADAEILKIDNEVSRIEERMQQEVASARQSYAEENPDFVDMYQSGELQQVMQDPRLSSVFGNNPAAAHQYIRSQKLNSENEQLKARLAELEKAQQTAISSAAQNPHKKIGTTGSGTAPTPPARQQKNSPTDSMLEAMRKVRGA